MLTIAVDAMGGDHAPKAEVEGAIRAVRVAAMSGSFWSATRTWSAQELAQHPRAARSAHRSPPRQRGHHHGGLAAKAVRSQERDSSIRVASRLVRDGVAQGFVSAGNTGAVMATAKMVQGMVRGVDRPALGLGVPHAQRQRPWWWWTSARTSIASPPCWRSSP